jgi:uncharacterized DUF497 family protein
MLGVSVEDEEFGGQFVWHIAKNAINIRDHKVSFYEAVRVFDDENYFIISDASHSENEARYFCFGRVEGRVLTLRFTLRGRKIRIIGAGYWRKGKQLYEARHG